jgi:arsenate reductase
MSLKVYGIPNCGTCKKALQWLDNNKIKYEFIDTKKNPPDRDRLQIWVEQLGSKSMRNTSGQSYRALGDTKNAWSDADWIEAFAKEPMLLKRPLFVRNETAVLVGFRSKEEVLKEKLS